MHKQLFFTLFLSINLAPQLAAMNLSQEQITEQLLHAAKNGDVETIINLYPASNNTVLDQDQRTPLMWAAHKGHFKVCQQLVAYGAPLDDQDSYGSTPLMFAAQSGHEHICRLMLEHKPNINIQNNGGYSALLYAAENGHKDIGRLLIEHGANINIQDHRGRTPLMHYADKDKRHMCDLLLEHGATINTQDSDGNTALMRAAFSGLPLTCELLITKGADIHIQNNNVKRTALGMTQCSRTSKLLLQHGAHVNVQDEDKATPLIRASQKNNPTLCQLLLEHGADIMMRDGVGTALTHAALEYDESSSKDGKTIKTLITYPIFNPMIQEECKESKNRIFAALCALKRVCPLMPRDVRYFILNSIPELRTDGANCAFGIHKKIHDRAPFLPLKVIRTLLKEKKLDPYLTVQSIKKHHATRLKPLILEATTDNPNDLFDLELFDAHYDADLDAIIKRRLELTSIDPAAKKAKISSGDKLILNAAQNGDLGTIINLYSVSDNNVKDKYQRTPLMLAALSGHEAVCKQLLDYGAPLDAQDRLGQTALMRAAKMHPENLCKLLLKHGANSNIQDTSGRTALMLVIQDGRYSKDAKKRKCQFLIAHGANIDIQDNDGYTALMMASSRYDCESIAKLLIEQGANINIQNINGDTALGMAAQYGTQEVCKLLIDRGADLTICNQEARAALNKLFFNRLSAREKAVHIKNKNASMVTAQLVFNRLSPRLPREIQNLILNMIREQDLEPTIDNSYDLFDSEQFDGNYSKKRKLSCPSNCAIL